MKSRLVICAVLVVGCAGDKDVVEPSPDGKADVASRVQDQGTIEWTGPRTGAFTEDLAFHGYRLAARAGALVTIDNTHLGTASQLDSTLFVYGPRTAAGYGTAAIAFDDDSGWGRHARIRNLALTDGGEYLIVLGTANGRGRGAYRLEARCENGACEPLPQPTSCDPGLSDGIQRCIATQIADGDLEGDTTLSYADAVELCTDGEALGPIYDDLCAATPAASFCGLAFEPFVMTAVPACRAELEQRTGLCGAYLTDALTQAADGMWFTSESDYAYEPVSWAGQGAPTPATVLTLSGLDPSSALGATSFASLFAFRGRPEEPNMDPFELDQLRRHRHLRRVLEGSLTDTLVVRIGTISIRVFLVGRTSCGETAGVATTSIET